MSGTVADKEGPLPGATVLVEGTSNGTVTDLDGRFSISVDSDGVLKVSYLGYATQSVAVNGRTNIDIKLEEDLQQLSEVVVVGYGVVQRKESVTGSVASIQGDAIRDVPAGNVSESLQGRLPGVEFAKTSSKPGATRQIRIRGTRSLTASNDPLIVLDGITFSGSLADISPNDIKSVDVLKDASATAIYGSRGANGVILITTERGQRGQQARLSYNSFTGVQTPFSEFPMMDGPDLIALREAAGQFTNGADESNDTDTNWQDLFYEPGIITNHDIGISGGSQTGKYNFGIAYYKEEAVIPSQEYERISLRGSLDQQIGDYFSIGFTTNNNYSVSDGFNLGLYGVLSSSPLASPYNEDGSLKRVVSLAADDQWVYTKESVNNIGDGWIDRNNSFGTYNSLYSELSIPGIEGLKYRVNLGLNLNMTRDGEYTGSGVFSATEDNLSQASVANTINTRWLVENLLSYDRNFGEKHNLNLVALYSAEETEYNRSSVVARDIPADYLQFYNLGQANGEISINPDAQDYQRYGLMSWMGRAIYSYDSRYLFTATIRSDGSSRLADGKKWNTYPAVSLGWNITEENFMQGINSLNLLKIRAGYGETSNQAIAPYATLGSLSTRPYNFGNDIYRTGYYVTQLPNDDLGWEYSTTWNIGLDFGLLQNRLTGTVEYYKTNTKDILLAVSLPSTSGVNSYTANIGETQNKGVELSLNAIILDNQDGFTWEVGANLYANRNELVSLSSGQDRDEGNGWFVGHPINVIYDYEKIGLWQQEDPYREILEPGDNVVGSIKVKYTGEYNADGTPVRAISPDDRQILDTNPDFLGGFNTRLAYKDFDLTAVGAFQSGGIIISTLYGSTGYLNLLSGRRGNVDVDYWTPENTDADYPNPAGIRSGDNPKYGTTLGYFDASYLKIRTISLGYNFNQNLLERIGISRFRIYATVQNPFVLFSPYNRESGMDPEPNSFGDENAATTGTYQSRLLTIGTNTPATRNYLLGINLTF
ncbi:SusC/RagA family TonB-linked outer membrane protein [Marivirga lumbricoides]|uniref:SusC/RagA family TonB-linked outer membrane protein n=1 Tax=Marivirga lumbricoides TaxID=1046115 RepID=A0ABQ1N5B7_9BACT|nr:SusC/RagA family TonB-linked outer membrane protein [Marivirga lumbricoides]